MKDCVIANAQSDIDIKANITEKLKRESCVNVDDISFDDEKGPQEALTHDAANHRS